MPAFNHVASLGGNGSCLGSGDSRLAAALIAAFSTVVKGGFIPQARHGGRLTVAVAVAGSKFEGTGFEKEQMGQIQLAFIGLEEGGGCFAIEGGRGDNDLPGADGAGTAGLAVALRGLSALPFCGLGWIVIFGDDFKKPALLGSSSQVSWKSLITKQGGVRET